MMQAQIVISSGEIVRNQSWASPTEVSVLVQETIRNIKNKLPLIQRSMQLYLANRDTEFILYRPIKVCNILYKVQNIQLFEFVFDFF